MFSYPSFTNPWWAFDACATLKPGPVGPGALSWGASGADLLPLAGPRYFLPPIAGGAPIPVLDEIKQAWDWTVENLLEPAGDFIVSVVQEIGKTLSGAFVAALAWVLRKVYTFLRVYLIDWVYPEDRWRFPEVPETVTPHPWGMFSRLFQLVAYALWGKLRDVGWWLLDRVRDFSHFVATGVSTLSGFIWNRASAVISAVGTALSSTATWIVDQAETAFGYAVEGIGNWFKPALEWLADRIFGVGKKLYGVAEDALRWLANRLFGIGETFGTKMADFSRWMGDRLLGEGRRLFGVMQDVAEWLANRIFGLGETFGTKLADFSRWMGDRLLGEGRRLFGVIQDAFKWLANRIFGVGKTFGNVIFSALEWTFGTVLEPIADTLGRKFQIPGKLLRGEYPSMLSFLNALLDPPPLKNILQFFGWILTAFLSLLVGMFPAMAPVNYKWAQPFHKLYRDRLLTPDEVIRARWRRFPVSHGYHAHLALQGYDDTDIAAYFFLSDLIPGPSDLVRFAVREAFDVGKATALGFVTPLPGDFAAWMKAQGYSEEWSNRYWWAHWDLPSVTQGFEMLHRAVITKAELDGLLIALDIPPKWIPRLLNISYNPITRVDVRRMYQAGVIKRDKVEQIYRWLGYSPADAILLTDWVVKAFPVKSTGPGLDLRELTTATIKQAYVRRLIGYNEAVDRLVDLDYPVEDAELILSIWDYDLAINPNLGSDIGVKDLTASVVERAYERRIFDYNRSLNELVDMGYTQEDAEVRLALVDQKLAEQLTDLAVDVVLNDVDAGVIDEDTARSRLTEYGLHPERIDFLLAREILRRQAKARRLTVSQLQRALGAGLLTADELFDSLSRFGYNDRDANILVALA